MLHKSTSDTPITFEVPHAHQSPFIMSVPCPSHQSPFLHISVPLQIKVPLASEPPFTSEPAFTLKTPLTSELT